MIDRFTTGFHIGFESFKFMFKKPKLLFAILIFWFFFLLFLTITYGIVYALDIDIDYIEQQGLENVFTIIMLFVLFFDYALANSISSLVVLELVEQHESTNEMHLRKALKDAFVRDLPKASLIVVLWSLTYILIVIIRMAIAAILRQRVGSARNNTMGLLTRGMKIIVAVTLPAIAWEELPTKQAIEKGFEVIKKTWLSIFGSGLFKVVAQVVFFLLVAIIAILIVRASDTDFVTYLLVILGAVLAMNLFNNLLSMMQQLYIANIYLWYQTWEQQSKTDPGIRLEDVKFPSFLDDIQDFLVLESPNDSY